MWLKGNLHTHTNLSDGDSEPADVCRYYADRGYDFISITDHSRYFGPEDLRCDGGDASGQKAAPKHIDGGIRTGPLRGKCGAAKTTEAARSELSKPGGQLK